MRYEQSALGGDNGDIASLAGNFEIKRRAGLPDWLQLGETVRAVLVRQDRGPWLLVLRASDGLKLIADAVREKRNRE
jgi:hypothetical protein